MTVPGKGRKVWRDEAELRAAIAAIEDEHGVSGLLAVEVRYRITAVRRNHERIEAKEKRLGWRALVTNAPAERLTLVGSVLTYREGGGLERPFHQLKDAPLGIRPLFVRLPEQVVGLTRLVLVALRVLTLVEIVLRARLAERGEQLEGL